MKSSQQMFNPAIEDYKMLKEVVVEREDDLNSILERLESTPLKGTSRNFIVMGPRGIGKTHFLLLIYYEIKERKGLSEKYVSIKFSEEEYSIDSLAFFFIRIFEELSNELGSEKEKAQINEFLELNSKLENREFVNLADAFLEKLMHKHRKKIVLCCENLDEMFKRISSSDKTDMGRLRSILQSRDYLLIMGSASTYFKEIKDYGEPFYHFFEHVRLSNLSDDGIEELIMKLAKIEDNKQVIKEFGKFRGKIKIITHFTGGVPRLVRMVYYVIANLEITEVMEEFEKLLDEVTPYYQSRMMGLSPQQQKIMDVIALGEGTRTPTEIADAGRMDRAIVNAQVKKLSDAGFIQLVKQRRRKERRYDITEKLFRIWREMRRAKGRERVKYLTDFLRVVYGDDDFERHLSAVDKKFFGCVKEGANSEAVRYLKECEYLKDIVPKKMRADFEYRLIEKYIFVGECEKADNELKIFREYIRKQRLGKKFDEKVFKLEVMKIDKILEKNPEDVSAILKKGKLLLENNKDEEALAVFERVLDIETENELVLMTIGVVIGFLGKHKEAIRIFDKVLEINPKNDVALAIKGFALLKNEKHKEAIHIFEKVLEINPKNESALLMKGKALDNLGKYEEAICTFDKVLKVNPKNEEALMEKGLSIMYFGKYKEAIHIFEKVLEINPKNEPALVAKGFALFNIDKYKEATHELDKALKINLKNELALSVKGDALGRMGRYKESIIILDKILKINPKDEGALFLKAKSLFALKKDKETIIILDKILKIHPKYADAWCMRYVAIYCRDKYKENGSLEERYDLFLDYFINLLRRDVRHCEEMFNVFKYRFGEKFVHTFDMVNKTITYFKYRKDEDKDEALVLEKLFPEEREIVNMLIGRVEKKKG